MAGKLYVVATPIGNASDMTLRGLEILGKVDLIAAEDTRTSGNLLRMHNIQTKLAAYHKFNETDSADYFINKLQNGEDIAIITDAGTPCISDPGYILVNRAVLAGVDVVGISGPCAAVTALSVSGFNTLSFSFYGFLPRAKSHISAVLERIKTEYSPITVFYESPKRIIATMRLMIEAIPTYNICLCNDLTKLYERIYRGTPLDILTALEANEKSDKGEYTMVISRTEVPADVPEETISIEGRLIDTMLKESCSMKDAISALSKGKDLSKKDVYAASLRLKDLLNL